MRKILLAIFCISSISGFALASENKSESDVLFDQYVQVTEAVKSSGWDYLGCASSKQMCQERSTARGYSESKLVYMGCNPRNTAWSCFAK
jgi:hypothetical protein